MIDLLKSIVTTRTRRRWSAVSLMTATGLVVLVTTLYAGAPAAVAKATAESPAEEAVEEAAPSSDLTQLEDRVARVTEAWSGAQQYYDVQVAPIERVLLRYKDDPALVERVAVALVREANKVGLEPRLLLAVLLVENPWLDPEIRSPVGAIGMMQVMPLHRGGWSECDDDLEDVDANICHGARIFAHYFNRSGGNVERALLRYNGCVNGTNTPDCHQYPYHVFARAGKASVLAWMGTGTGAAAP